MHLYQVFQNSFNKIAAPGPGLAGPKAGPEVGLHYQEWPQAQAYVGADLDFPQKNSYGSGYDQTGYYMPESMYYGAGTGTMSPPPGMAPFIIIRWKKSPVDEATFLTFLQNCYFA